MGFTMCVNKKCDKARECLRFVSENNKGDYQSYSNFDECIIKRVDMSVL